MTITLNQPSADLRRSGISGRAYEPTMMEIVATDDKSKALPPYSGPTPPMHRIPHSDGPHGLPGGPGLYDQSWRPYPSPIDSHPPEQRRTSNAPQPPLPSHAYSAMQTRELPQLPPDGPYGRPGGLPGPTHAPSEPPPPHPSFHSMNGAPHEPTPHSAPPDYRPRMSFPPQESHSNGDPPPPPPSLPPSQYPTTVPPPISQTPAPYDTSYYQNPAFGIRQRKAARAQQACDQCRARKAKCDEGRPACSHCKENNLICVYKEVPPHKQEKATQLLLDRMQQLEDRLEDRLSQFQAIQVEQSLLLGRLTTEFKLKDGVAIDGDELQKQSGYTFTKPAAIETAQESKTKETAAVGGQNPNALEQLLQAGEDGELSIPVEHTTAAHKLLGWPVIQDLLGPYEYDEDYVMKLEEDRGLLCVYGRGEEDDTSEVNPAQTPTMNSNWNERYSQSTSPGAPWNIGAGVNGNTEKLEVRGINDARMMCIDGETVRAYFCSYMEHIHRLHPFLDPVDTEAKINMFISQYCPGGSSPSAPMLNRTNSMDMQRGAKRKRSCEMLQANIQSPTGIKSEHTGPREVERTIGNAIILLILALGRVCQVRMKAIRGPATDKPVDFRNQYIPRPATKVVKSPGGTETTVPQQNSFYSSHQSQSLSSPSVVDAQGDDKRLRNIDTVPGLVYYGYATDIMGNLQGANKLPHVHAALLAGLYAGQLAHPFQSHGWIFQAARACQVLVRAKRYDKLDDGNVKDLYNFAYWTCLQLESDILAELDLPASGISRSEARIQLPKGRFTLTLPNDISAPSTMMMFFYSAQIHLRKVLNRVHTDLYKIERDGQTKWWTSNVQEILSMNLDLWRHSLPEVMRWKDNDPPSSDINVARMRAKYYGARYIIHRPLLYHAIHIASGIDPVPPKQSTGSNAAAGMSGSKSQQVSPSLPHSQRAPNMMRMSSDIGTPSRRPTLPMVAYRDLPGKMRRACKVCIDSAILSTDAFDGIQGRPVVTNIFGTAHAQFGNMLVLSTTYTSPLSELVDRNDLERLLKRTITFLLQSQHISPSLRADAKILTQIYEKIFGEPVRSFSSHS